MHAFIYFTSHILPLLAIVLAVYAGLSYLKYRKHDTHTTGWLLIAIVCFIVAARQLVVYVLMIVSDDFIYYGLADDLISVAMSIILLFSSIYTGRQILDWKANLYEAASKFNTLFSDNIDHIYIIDNTGNFLDVNKTTCDVLGYTKAEMLEMNIRDILSLKFSNTFYQLTEEIRKEGNFIIESEQISKDKRIFPVEIKCRLITYAEISGILCIARDITERKNSERKILNTIIETEEKERERFAKDLHDGLGTLLSSINLYTNLLKTGQLNNEEQHQVLDSIKGLVDESVMNAKEIANNIRPNVISRFGLLASVQSLCEKINNTGILKIQFSVYNIENNEFSKDIEVALYRIINELINNTIKHSGARKATIELSQKEKQIILKYHDNGAGFNVTEILNSGKGMGLSNIISRVKAIDGTCTINSTPLDGSVFLINIQCP